VRSDRDSGRGGEGRAGSHAMTEESSETVTIGSQEALVVEIAPRITVDESVRFGRPVIAGTRVPVDVVIGQLAAGMNVAGVAAEYGISEEDVLAALAYAAHAIAEEEVRPVP
jgi:uncharacterized protein (DUF433 family)